MGRRPIGKVAMSAAERMRRYRATSNADIKADMPQEEPPTINAAVASLTRDLAQAKARIRELEAELAQARARLEDQAELARSRGKITADDGTDAGAADKKREPPPPLPESIAEWDKQRAQTRGHRRTRERQAAPPA
jgi:hypothetical protein